MLKTLAFALVVGYVGLAGVLWFLQERLLFFPQPALADAAAPAGWTLERVAFVARDGTRLAGVLVKPPAARPPVILYYGGNAEETTAGALNAARSGERAQLFMNYRGYGGSEGRPTQEALFSDALEIYDWMARRGDIDATRIAVHGRSLGTGVAVHVAASRPVKAVVLTSPYDSILEIARSHYPWVPVAWILRHPFDSAALAPRLKVPALVLMASDDGIVARKHSEKLASLWGGPIERVLVEGRGHNDLEVDPKYFPAIAGFLDRHL